MNTGYSGGFYVGSGRITSPSRSLARTSGLFLLLSLAAFVVFTVPTAAAAASVPDPQEPASEEPPSTEDIIADLEAYIPVQLEVVDVPGLSIALIRAGEVVWEDGFGVANTLSGGAVTRDSVFEVASLGKPVAAYAALTLVESGVLELDEPVYPLFDRPWLPRSDWADQITLRQLLDHTSGLSMRLHPLDRSIAFQPGERHAYSNVGYQYVQAVIEQVSGASLDSVASTAIFGPIGMTLSTFADDPEVVSGLVSGHMDYATDLAVLLATLAVCLALVFAVYIVFQRLRKKRVAITWRLITLLYAVATVASLPLLAWLNGGFNKWWLFCLTELAIFSAWVVAWTIVSRLWIRRYSDEWRSGGRLWFLRVVSFLGCLAVFALAANAISGPVPKGPLETPSAALSLKTTAGDLARFMIELVSPEHLGADLAAEMVRPQVEISDTDAYGLGIAVYHARAADWLWHSGDNHGFQSLMAICPATGDGVVLLANGQNGCLLNGRIVRRALGIDFRVER